MFNRDKSDGLDNLTNAQLSYMIAGLMHRRTDNRQVILHLAEGGVCTRVRIRLSHSVYGLDAYAEKWYPTSQPSDFTDVEAEIKLRGWCYESIRRSCPESYTFTIDLGNDTTVTAKSDKPYHAGCIAFLRACGKTKADAPRVDRVGDIIV